MGRKKTCTTISEHRRQQNRLSQQRWREKRRSAVVVEKSYNQSEYHNSSPSDKHENVESSTSSASKTESLQSRQKSTPNDSGYSAAETVSSSFLSDSTATYIHDLGEVSAKDIIDALALPEDDSGSDSNWQTTSLQDINPQRLSKSQLLSLAYCSPSISYNFSLQSMHFAKALIRNTIAFGFDIRYMSKTESISFIAQDWFKHLAAQQSSNGFGNKGLDQSGEKDTTSSQKIVREAHIPSESSQLLRWKELPKNMLPTEDQLTIKHHPYIDVSFPWPKMRSKLLKLLYSVIDYNEFCDAVFKAGLPGAEIDEPAFYIWGDETMDESAWEVGEGFAKKWWFLLDDAIIRRTNWWRRLRGLEELSIDLKSSV